MYSKCLSDATAYLEEQLLIPMEELSQRLKYRIELLKHVYTTQVDILQGQQSQQTQKSPNTGSSGNNGDNQGGQVDSEEYLPKLMAILNKPTKTKADMTELKSHGVVKLLHAVQTRQEQLLQRVAESTSMYRIQKELVENSIAQSLYIHSQQIQPEERAFQKKVHEWRHYVTTLDRSIANLERQMDVLRASVGSGSSLMGGSRGTSPAPSTGSTPMKTQQQWLTERANASAGMGSVIKSPMVGAGVPMSPQPGTPNTTIAGAATWFKRNRASRSGVSTPVTASRRVVAAGASSSTPAQSSTPVHSLLSSMTLNDVSRRTQRTSTAGTSDRLTGAVSNAVYGAAGGRKTSGVTMASLLSPGSATGVTASSAANETRLVHPASFSSPERVATVSAVNSAARRNSKTIISTLFNSPLPVNHGHNQSYRLGLHVNTTGVADSTDAAGSGENPAPYSLDQVQYSVRDRDYMKELLVAQAKALRECNHRIRSLDKSISGWAQAQHAE